LNLPPENKGVKIADQWEKAIVLRLGKYTGSPKGPGLFFIIPIIERVDIYIDQRLRVDDVEAENSLTKDTVPVFVDAVVYWMVWDAAVAWYEYAIRRLKRKGLADHCTQLGTGIHEPRCNRRARRPGRASQEGACINNRPCRYM